jgi:hypothetical protein
MITDCVGQVSRMIRHGLDPNLLVLSDEEAAEQLSKLGDMANEAGVPTAVIVPDDGDRGGRGRSKN